MEYFQDLGLEYNVDYVDASKEKTTKKQLEEGKNINKVDMKKESSDKPEEKEDKPTIKIENESKKQDVDDDNLFDLIDSMYSEDN